MKRLGTNAVATLAAALTLTGCGITAPTPTAPPSSSATSASASASAPVTSSGPTPTPSATSLVLSGAGIGDDPFGTAQAKVVKVLTATLGKPSDSSQGITCELDSSTPWGETLIYDDLWVQFTAKNSQKSSPRTLTAWGFQLNKALPTALAIGDDVPLNLSFKQLKASYPGAKYLDVGLEDGTKALRLPNKLLFVGVDKPEVVRAGELQLCE
jgi:hypothetical protein